MPLGFIEIHNGLIHDKANEVLKSKEGWQMGFDIIIWFQKQLIRKIHNNCSTQRNKIYNVSKFKNF